MHNVCAVYCLTVVLCLVVCVSASTPVSKEDATTAVGQAKASVTEVHERAQSELDKATVLLQRVELSKNQAAQASSQAAKTATGNKEAEDIAQKIKSLSNAVGTSHSNAKGKLSTAVSTLTTLLSKAKELKGKPDIQIKAKDSAPDDFTDTTTEATALKGQADNLNESITNAVTPVSEVSAKADEMESNVKEAQIGAFQVSAIVAVAKIKSMLASAKNIILQIEGKKNKVSGIVDQMQTLQRNAPTVSDDNIKALHTNGANELAAATAAVDKAKRAKAAIQTQKGLADAALTKVKAETNDVSKAQNEANTAEECVTAAQLIVPQLDNTMQTAETSATNANNFKEKLKTALSTTTTAPSTVQASETEKANPPVGQGTEPDQEDTLMQPTSKELPSQSNDSAEEIKDALIKGAQNVPTTALTGRKAPAPGAKNDSAMTVSVPLLVALIASAVLQ